MIMNKEKICPICKAFEDKKYIPELILHINKLIILREPAEVLNKESALVFSDYYYKKHREECLIDFEIPVEEQKIKLAKEKTKLFNKQFLDISSIITDFRNMSDEEKQSRKIKMMYEIEYLILNIIHHQLVNGLDDNSVKGIIPKEDINAFKTIKDIMSKPDIQSEEYKLNLVNKFNYKNL
jgi:hypothetical protein